MSEEIAKFQKAITDSLINAHFSIIKSNKILELLISKDKDFAEEIKNNMEQIDERCFESLCKMFPDMGIKKVSKKEEDKGML